MTLGYTRTGIAVCLPTHRTPSLDSFAGWTRGDHVDASRILVEHGERETDVQIGDWCLRWARLHKGAAKSKHSPRIRTAAETAILAGRR